MESFIHLRKGVTPQRLHADLDGLKDDELGRAGFTGRTAILYHRNDPTAFRAAGPLRPLDVLSNEIKPTDAVDSRGEPSLLFHNADCRILLSRRSTEMPFHVRHIDGDLLIFVHAGTGTFETEMGPLAYRPGDWVYLPKALTFRQIPDNESFLFMIEAVDEFRVPPAGTLGRHFPFDPSQITIPDPQPIDDDGRDEYEVRLVHEGGPSSLFYKHNPIDAEGWRGDNVPFTFNIDQYTAIGSEAIHLPPTVHLFMQATGVYIMNFLPRPAEMLPGVERTPWYHRNVDFDEIAFFHGGSVFGIEMPPSLLTHAPQGIHHGAPERARERARRRHDVDSRIEWKVISIDTRRRLTPSPELLTHVIGS
ncbi:homogentisate 1,2-dioxygenase [Aldersonia kunmingensis]|uniref:homogentisate 1,2-dioxygenase n=1 Tax=Aldersonia kunmingensis TaxID=408066 RepID=UPI00082DBD10|nr:homogentisate 1,2-dioxygenase [Aldersonia kunmingensis]